MLFLKSTQVTKAPGIYEVDIAAKPPGKTFGIYLATDPDNPPTAVLNARGNGLHEYPYPGLHPQRPRQGAGPAFPEEWHRPVQWLENRGMQRQPGRHRIPV
ncbi:hypothetical protein LP420_19675 [Massilia sp. B-10]|nr:hypothetical protein LP420_19675 [Massilia sp. B-10]